ncbi:MAG: histidine phosphatase family protein [Nakamurella sp.]
MSRIFHLVRHGQSTWNLEHRVQGAQHEPPLTDLGRHQARAAAAALLDLLGGRPGLLMTSDQQRAVQTAEIIGGALGLRAIPTPLLREQGWGLLEGLTTTAAMAELADVDLSDPDFRWAGGESTTDVLSRVAELLGSATITDLPVGTEIILVSHGDTIRVLMTHLLGERLAEAPWRQFENGSVTTISGNRRPGQVACRRPIDDPTVDKARGAAAKASRPGRSLP